MFWIVQNNVFSEERYDLVIATLQRGQIPFAVVTVVPFSHELIPYPIVDGPVAVIGSYGLVKIAKSLGWGPGVFYNDQIDFNIYADKFGNHMLNYDAKVCRFGEVVMTEPSFIRPTDDGKSFAGGVISPHDFDDWRERICSIDGFATIDMDTQVVVAPYKEIHSEYRFFVVDNKIVSASRYKLGNRLNPSEDVPYDLHQSAYEFIQIWQPDRAFVIDLAITDQGVKIVEFNNINAAGWYKADVSKIIQAIDNLA